MPRCCCCCCMTPVASGTTVSLHHAGSTTDVQTTAHTAAPEPHPSTHTPSLIETINSRVQQSGITHFKPLTRPHLLLLLQAPRCLLAPRPPLPVAPLCSLSQRRPRARHTAAAAPCWGPSPAGTCLQGEGHSTSQIVMTWVGELMYGYNCGRCLPSGGGTHTNNKQECLKQRWFSTGCMEEYDKLSMAMPTCFAGTGGEGRTGKAGMVKRLCLTSPAPTTWC